MGRRRVPQNVHILKLGTYENVNIRGKRNVTNMVKDLTTGGWRDFPELSG